MRPRPNITAGGLLAVLAPLALSACAGDPVPKAELGAATQAVQNAQLAGAPQFAPAELELARSKLDAAQQALRDDRESQARRLALEARADADFAAARARAGAAQRAASVANRDWNALGSVQSGASGEGSAPTQGSDMQRGWR